MIVAFYSQATGWVHQIGVLSGNERPREAKPGEARFDVPDGVFKQFMAVWKDKGDQNPVQEFLNQQRGQQPVVADYAVVQNGVVVNVIGKADPALGHLDNASAQPAQIVRTDGTVEQGATYDGQRFTNPVQPVSVKGASVGS